MEPVATATPRAREAVERATLALVLAVLLVVLGAVVIVLSARLPDTDIEELLLALGQTANLATATATGVALAGAIAWGDPSPRARSVIGFVLVLAVLHVVAGGLGLVGLWTSHAQVDNDLRIGETLVLLGTVVAGAALGQVASAARSWASVPSPCDDPAAT